MKSTRATNGIRPVLSWMLALSLGLGASLGLVACNRNAGTTPSTTGGSSTGTSGAGSSTTPSTPDSGTAGGSSTSGAGSMPASTPSTGASAAMPGASPASMPR